VRAEFTLLIKTAVLKEEKKLLGQLFIIPEIGIRKP
jgi:hypothetical protein